MGPLYFLATRVIARGVPTTVALGARTALDLPYVEQFRALKVDLILATDDGSLGHKGYVTDLVAQQTNPPTIYACGPEPMLVTIHRLCRERDIPGEADRRGLAWRPCRTPRVRASRAGSVI